MGWRCEEVGEGLLRLLLFADVDKLREEFGMAFQRLERRLLLIVKSTLGQRLMLYHPLVFHRDIALDIIHHNLAGILRGIFERF